MSSASTHIVHSQRLDIQWPADLTPDPGEKARDLALRMAEVLDQALDRWAGTDRWLFLDRLELELNVVQGPGWEQQILDQLKIRLREFESPGGERGGFPESTMDFADAHHRDRTLVEYILGKGYLPWWSGLRGEGGLPLKEWISRGLLDPRGFREPLSPAALDLWTELMGNQLMDFLSAWEPITRAKDSVGFLEFLRELRKVAHPSYGKVAAHLIRQLVSAHWGSFSTPASFNRILAFPLEGVPVDEFAFGPAERWKEVYRKAYGRSVPSRGDRPFSPPGIEAVGDRLNLAGEPEVVRDPKEKDIGPGELRPDPSRILYTSWAGMVILAPFLPHFWERLDLRPWENPGHREKALILWHYLARGEEGLEFAEGPLLKILLGMDPGEGIPLEGLALEEDERQEADGLLDAVAHQWEKLGNSSGRALRENFIAREARILEGEREWTMTVKPQALDVLIPFIPWTIGLIRLPWMDKPLYTNWKP